MGNPLKNNYFQIKNYIVCPNKNCIPLGWKDCWYDDSKILFIKNPSINQILNDAFGLSNSEVKRLIEQGAIKIDKDIKDNVFDGGLFEIRIGNRRVINLWHCEYGHTLKDKIYFYILEPIIKLFKDTRAKERK